MLALSSLAETLQVIQCDLSNLATGSHRPIASLDAYTLVAANDVFLVRLDLTKMFSKKGGHLEHSQGLPPTLTESFNGYPHYGAQKLPNPRKESPRCSLIIAWIATTHFKTHIYQRLWNK